MIKFVKEIFLINMLSVLLVFLSVKVWAWDYGAGIGVSTLGITGNIEKKLTSRLVLRGGYHYFTYTWDGTEDDVKYNIDLKLNSGLIVLDLHPFKGAFRISAGILINGNRIDADASLDPTESYEIGDKEYTGAEIGSLEMEVDFNTIAPYVGLGLGIGYKKGLSLMFDLGMVFQGSPDISLKVNSPLAQSTDPVDQAKWNQLQQDINKEEKNLEDELNNFKYYPVVMLTIIYRF